MTVEVHVIKPIDSDLYGLGTRNHIAPWGSGNHNEYGAAMALSGAITHPTIYGPRYRNAWYLRDAFGIPTKWTWSYSPLPPWWGMHIRNGDHRHPIAWLERLRDFFAGGAQKQPPFKPLDRWIVCKVDVSISVTASGPTPVPDNVYYADPHAASTGSGRGDVWFKTATVMYADADLQNAIDYVDANELAWPFTGPPVR